VPQLTRLIPGFTPQQSGFAPGQAMLDLWWTKRHWGRFSQSTSVSIAKSSFHQFLHHNHPGWPQCRVDSIGLPHYTYLSIYLWLYSPLFGLGRFLSFLIFYTAGSIPSVARPLPAHRTAQTQNKHTQTPMPRGGFETTIPVFERAKAVHALDRAATGYIKMKTVQEFDVPFIK
jgi:hypothetical protein